jgi:hypothetical protein
MRGHKRESHFVDFVLVVGHEVAPFVRSHRCIGPGLVHTDTDLRTANVLPVVYQAGKLFLETLLLCGIR